MRKYTAEQTAARNEYTRQWRLRNKDKIRANEVLYRARRQKLARLRRKRNPEKYREWYRKSARRRAASRREYTRRYTLKKLAINPNYRRERLREFTASNPNYWREYRARRSFRLAWLSWSRICAAGRLA